MQIKPRKNRIKTVDYEMSIKDNIYVITNIDMKEKRKEKKKET